MADDIEQLQAVGDLAATINSRVGGLLAGKDGLLVASAFGLLAAMTLGGGLKNDGKDAQEAGLARLFVAMQREFIAAANR